MTQIIKIKFLTFHLKIEEVIKFNVRVKFQIVRSNLIIKLKTNEITYVMLCYCDLRYYT